MEIKKKKNPRTCIFRELNENTKDIAEGKKNTDSVEREKCEKLFFEKKLTRSWACLKHRFPWSI